VDTGFGQTIPDSLFKDVNSFKAIKTQESPLGILTGHSDPPHP